MEFLSFRTVVLLGWSNDPFLSLLLLLFALFLADAFRDTRIGERMLNLVACRVFPHEWVLKIYTASPLHFSFDYIAPFDKSFVP